MRKLMPLSALILALLLTACGAASAQVCINGAVYADSGHAVPAEPDESVIHHAELPLSDGRTLQGFAQLENGAQTLCLVDGEWVEFVPSDADPDDELPTLQVLRATLLGFHGSSMELTPAAGSWELSSADRIDVAIVNMPAAPEPVPGDTLEIVYDGCLLETYPAGLGHVYSIRVVDR